MMGCLCTPEEVRSTKYDEFLFWTFSIFIDKWVDLVSARRYFAQYSG